MKQKQTLTALLLAGAVILSPSLVGQEQELEQREQEPGQGRLIREVNLSEDVKLSIMERDPAENSRPVEVPEMTEAMMVKQILGEIYTEVVHIPEEQWINDLEPIAERYVNIFFESRKMQDREEATRRVQEARAKYEADIKSKLTQDQLNTWSQRQAEEKARMQRYAQEIISVKEEIIQAIEETNDLSSKTIKIELK